MDFIVKFIGRCSCTRSLKRRFIDKLIPCVWTLNGSHPVGVLLDLWITSTTFSSQFRLAHYNRETLYRTRNSIGDLKRIRIPKMLPCTSKLCVSMVEMPYQCYSMLLLKCYSVASIHVASLLS